MIKILIAEDEPLSLQNLTGYLRRRLGMDALIECASNGREAVDKAAQIEPQLIFMDIEMPVMNGLEAASIIRQAHADTKIVFLTAFDRFDYAVGAMRTGASEYLLKPFDRAQVDKCLCKILVLPEDAADIQAYENHTPFQTQFSVWLAHRYMLDIALDQAAEAMGMSTFYFSRMFRTAYNQTFLEYLAEYRIARAVELLQSTEFTVREIAQRVGYPDAGYFSKVFKRYIGITPTEYRQTTL